MVCPRRVAFLAKEEYWTTPGIKGRFMKGFFTGIGAVPVRRGDHRAAQAALDTALEVVESGVAFGIYPEGTRSRDGRLYRARVGVGWLALKSKAPIVPVGVIGTNVVLPVGAKFPRMKKITLRFGEPILAWEVPFPGEAVAENSRARRAVADAVVSEIGKLTGQEYTGVYNEKPSGRRSERSAATGVGPGAARGPRTVGPCHGGLRLSSRPASALLPGVVAGVWLRWPGGRAR